MNKNKVLFPKTNKIQNVEFGLVVILIVSILSYLFDRKELIFLTIVLSFITISAPVLLSPFAAFWKGFSWMLNVLSSTVLLCLIFCFVVTPIALLRRITGTDSLRLKQFKKGRQSVLTDRNHLYTRADLRDTF